MTQHSVQVHMRCRITFSPLPPPGTRRTTSTYSPLQLLAIITQSRAKVNGNCLKRPWDRASPSIAIPRRMPPRQARRRRPRKDTGPGQDERPGKQRVWKRRPPSGNSDCHVEKHVRSVTHPQRERLGSRRCYRCRPAEAARDLSGKSFRTPNSNSDSHGAADSGLGASVGQEPRARSGGYVRA